jgi:hypothetical protein
MNAFMFERLQIQTNLTLDQIRDSLTTITATRTNFIENLMGFGFAPQGKFFRGWIFQKRAKIIRFSSTLTPPRQKVTSIVADLKFDDQTIELTFRLNYFYAIFLYLWLGLFGIGTIFTWYVFVSNLKNLSSLLWAIGLTLIFLFVLFACIFEFNDEVKQNKQFLQELFIKKS